MFLYHSFLELTKYCLFTNHVNFSYSVVKVPIKSFSTASDEALHTQTQLFKIGVYFYNQMH